MAEIMRFRTNLRCFVSGNCRSCLVFILTVYIILFIEHTVILMHDGTHTDGLNHVQSIASADKNAYVGRSLDSYIAPASMSERVDALKNTSWRHEPDNGSLSNSRINFSGRSRDSNRIEPHAVPSPSSSPPSASPSQPAAVHQLFSEKLTEHRQRTKSTFVKRKYDSKTHQDATIVEIARIVYNDSSISNSSSAEQFSIEDLQKHYYQRREKIINEYNYGYELLPHQRCQSDVFVLILIHSKPDYADRRTAIRNTWGSVVKPGSTWGSNTFDVSININFVIGQSDDEKQNQQVLEESMEFGDILHGNFMDSYKNMTLKSLLGLKYASEYCKHVPYLLKSDDDMFINLPHLVDVLRNETFYRSVMGPYNGMSKVYRKGKWKLEKHEFPFEFLPPYESGSAYVITMDIVPELYDTSKYVPWIFIDDVYITGILGRIVNITHVQKSEKFAYWTDKKPKFCDIILNKKIALTKCTPKVLTALWEYVCTSQQYMNTCLYEIPRQEEAERKRRIEAIRQKRLEQRKAAQDAEKAAQSAAADKRVRHTWSIDTKTKKQSVDTHALKVKDAKKLLML